MTTKKAISQMWKLLHEWGKSDGYDDSDIYHIYRLAVEKCTSMHDKKNGGKRQDEKR